MDYSSLFATTMFTGVRFTRFFYQSVTWIAPYDGYAVFTNFGGSASGGVAIGSSASADTGPCATGGGAGSMCRKVVKVKAGDAYVITIGAGGLGQQISAAPYFKFGADGGDTTTVGPGVNMVAGGGKAGKAGLGGLALDGGLGGIATGGDENYDGGRGGNIVAASLMQYCRATGGGALPLLGKGFHGGDVTSAAVAYATGGAGVGGDGSTLHGGGSGTSADATNPGYPPLGPLTENTLSPLMPWLRTAGPGGLGDASTAPTTPASAGTGGGGGGKWYQNTSSFQLPGAPGLFGGGGGYLGGPSTSGMPAQGYRCSAEARNVYGGSGAAVHPRNVAVASANGGNGFALVEML